VTIDLVAILRWVMDAMKGVHAFATLIGILLGVALAEFMAHMLPPEMNAYTADRLTRLICLGVSLTTTFALDSTLPGFFLALLAGLAGPTVHGFTLRYVNHHWPNFTPKALIDAPGDPIRVRPIIPEEQS
jgi:hypothetical protein